MISASTSRERAFAQGNLNFASNQIMKTKKFRAVSNELLQTKDNIQENHMINYGTISYPKNSD